MSEKKWWVFRDGSMGYETGEGYVKVSDNHSSDSVYPATKIEFVISRYYFRSISEIDNTHEVTSDRYPMWKAWLNGSGLIPNSTMKKYGQRITGEQAQCILGSLKLIEAYEDPYWLSIGTAWEKAGITWSE